MQNKMLSAPAGGSRTRSWRECCSAAGYSMAALGGWLHHGIPTSICIARKVSTMSFATSSESALSVPTITSHRGSVIRTELHIRCVVRDGRLRGAGILRILFFIRGGVGLPVPRLRISGRPSHGSLHSLCTFLADQVKRHHLIPIFGAAKVANVNR
jgi:hypothetical protein